MHAVQVLYLLLVLPAAERAHDRRLGLAAREEARAVDARKPADLARDRADVLRAAAVEPAAGDRLFAHELAQVLVEQLADQLRVRRLRMLRIGKLHLHGGAGGGDRLPARGLVARGKGGSQRCPGTLDHLRQELGGGAAGASTLLGPASFAISRSRRTGAHRFGGEVEGGEHLRFGASPPAPRPSQTLRVRDHHEVEIGGRTLGSARHGDELPSTRATRTPATGPAQGRLALEGGGDDRSRALRDRSRGHRRGRSPAPGFPGEVAGKSGRMVRSMSRLRAPRDRDPASRLR